MSSFDVLALGEAMIEFNQTQPGAAQYLQGFGGDSSNLVIAAGRLGARTAYVTRIGDDEFGRLLLALWEREGVNAQGVAIDAQRHTAAYFVTHGPQGHVFSYLRAGSAASAMRPQDLPLNLIQDASYVHASGISMAISSNAADCVLAAFDAARTARAKIAFDANLRLKLWPLAQARVSIAAAVKHAECFFLSIEDAHALSECQRTDEILAWAHQLGAKVVFLKLGADGVVVSDGSKSEHIAGLRVQTVDATGAGDCFAGAALARLVRGDSIWDAAHYANAAAALSTTGFGAVAPMPRAEDVEKVLSASN